MAADLTGKIVLVTGGASGIGKATAEALIRAGATVVISDINESAGKEAVRDLRALAAQGQELAAGSRGDGTVGVLERVAEAAFVQADVSNPEEAQEMVQSVVDMYGRLDCAFNNAGIEGTLATTVECTEENWNRTIDINLKGVWLCMKYEIPEILKSGGGAIVNTASVAGMVGWQNLAAYCASKGGVIQLTRVAALEYAKEGLRVNAVCPGAIDTPMVDRVGGAVAGFKENVAAAHPVGRLGLPSEIADAVVWLCSDESSFVTGQAIAVDGGYTTQ